MPKILKAQGASDSAGFHHSTPNSIYNHSSSPHRLSSQMPDSTGTSLECDANHFASRFGPIF